MNEQDRLFIFILAGKIAQANVMMKSIDRVPSQDTGELTFGSVKLSPTGNEPTTHYACSTTTDEDYKNALFGTSHSPWMDIYKQSDGHTFESAYADMGLKRIDGEDL